MSLRRQDSAGPSETQRDCPWNLEVPCCRVGDGCRMSNVPKASNQSFAVGKSQCPYQCKFHSMFRPSQYKCEINSCSESARLCQLCLWRSLSGVDKRARPRTDSRSLHATKIAHHVNRREHVQACLVLRRALTQRYSFGSTILTFTVVASKAILVRSSILSRAQNFQTVDTDIAREQPSSDLPGKPRRVPELATKAKIMVGLQVYSTKPHYPIPSRNVIHIVALRVERKV